MVCRVLLFWCLLFSLFCTIPAYGDSKRVVFIRYRIPLAEFTTVVAGFKQVMAERGFVEGKNIEYVDIRTRSADKSSIPDVDEALAQWQGKADLIITCGWVSMHAREVLKNTDTPQLFVPVLESVARRMLPSMHEPPATNLSGTYLMYPPEKILRLAHLLLPGLTNYGYVYDSRIPADMIFKEAYEKLPSTKRHGATIHFFDLAGGVDQVLAAMGEQKIEAFGGIIGAFQKRIELAASGLPVITSFTLDIKQEQLQHYVREGNVVAGLFNPFRYCGEQAAEMAADIFQGKQRIETTLPRPAKQIAFINLEAAARLHLQVPFTALESVDMVVK